MSERKGAISLILPYYMNAGMLERQFESIRSLDRDVLDSLEVLVIDDGSPERPAFFPAPDLGCPFRLFRIEVDVRWNWIAARNIGAYHAWHEWLLLTDIDHVVPEETFLSLAARALDTKAVHKFSRRDAPDLTPYKPHPNSWLMTRKTFLERVKGYDERFSGYYGTDGEFRDRCVSGTGRPIVELDEYIVRYPREVIADASTTTYKRKQPEDREAVPRIRREIAKSPEPHRLTFPYHEVLP